MPYPAPRSIHRTPLSRNSITHLSKVSISPSKNKPVITRTPTPRNSLIQSQAFGSTLPIQMRQKPHSVYLFIIRYTAAISPFNYPSFPIHLRSRDSLPLHSSPHKIPPCPNIFRSFLHHQSIQIIQHKRKNTIQILNRLLLLTNDLF